MSQYYLLIYILTTYIAIGKSKIHTPKVTQIKPTYKIFSKMHFDISMSLIMIK